MPIYIQAHMHVCECMIWVCVNTHECLHVQVPYEHRNMEGMSVCVCSWCIEHRGLQYDQKG